MAPGTNVGAASPVCPESVREALTLLSSEGNFILPIF